VQIGPLYIAHRVINLHLYPHLLFSGKNALGLR